MAAEARRDWIGQVLRFAAVGVANTAVGLGIIATLLLLGVNDYAANVSGYAVGMMLSATLNRNWTFAAEAPFRWREGLGLAAIYGLAYGLSLCTLTLMRAMGHQQSLVGQLAAMATYTTSSFLLLRMFVTRTADGRS